MNKLDLMAIKHHLDGARDTNSTLFGLGELLERMHLEAVDSRDDEESSELCNDFTISTVTKAIRIVANEQFRHLDYIEKQFRQMPAAGA